jgi:SynChlorMet cassette radical SAM/SPASM protein ScmF
MGQATTMTAAADSSPPLREIYLYLTGSCNLKCRHCWIAPSYGTTAGKHLPWAELKKIIEQAVPLGMSRIKLTGGEPFLHPEINRILYALREMKLAIRVETNGTLIGAEEARALRDAGVSFSISLDGPTASLHDDLRGVPGSFDRTLKGIECVRREGLAFEIITCLHRKNRHSLLAMVGLAKQFGARSLKINPINGIARSESMAAQGDLLTFAEILETHETVASTVAPDGLSITFDLPPAFKSTREITATGFCTCGILSILGVLPDGRASLCGIGTHQRELDFGDLTVGGLADVWNNHPVLKSLRDNVPAHLGGICGRCIFRNYCLGKCVAQVFYETRGLFGGYSFCQWAYDNGRFPKTRVVEHGK